jgi:hypothetical protein
MQVYGFRIHDNAMDTIPMKLMTSSQNVFRPDRPQQRRVKLQKWAKGYWDLLP